MQMESRRYPTRSGNRHPGIKAGLAVRTREQVQAAAKARRQQAEAELAQQEAEEAIQNAHREQNVRRLANIIDRQTQEEWDDAGQACSCMFRSSLDHIT